MRRRARAFSATAVAIALAAAGLSFANPEPPISAEAPGALEVALSSARQAALERGDTEIRVPPKERPQVHDLSYAKAGDEEVPLVWYHPLAGERVLPARTSRIFGAHRPGDRPDECGQGHCGVDLGYERGPVVHAARPGLIDRIVKAPHRLGGQYVRLYHPEGFFTYYMHLDAIRPTLVPGVEVAAGEPLGTLGSTGISHSPPHLHFAVAQILDTGAQHYLDPEPMLRQAVVLEEPAPFPEEWRRRPPRMASERERPRGGDEAEKSDGASAREEPAEGAANEGEVAGPPADEVADSREAPPAAGVDVGQVIEGDVELGIAPAPAAASP